MAQERGAIKPPKQIPRDLREFSRWCQEQEIFTADSSVGTAQIEDEAITLAKMADLASDTVIGQRSGGGAPEAITFAQLATELGGETWAFTVSVDFQAGATFAGNMGFFGASAVAQQTTPSTLSMTSVSGTGDDATINANFSAIQSAVNAIKTAIDNLGLTA